MVGQGYQSELGAVVSHWKRPRMIHPSLWDSERIAKLSDLEFKLYIWFITQADDDGRGDWFLSRIAGSMEPINPRSLKIYAAAAKALNDSGLIHIYSINGKNYYEVVKWKCFQYIRKDRYTPTTYPPPPCGIPGGVPGGLPGGSTNDNYNLIQEEEPVARGATCEVELPLSIQKSKEIHQREYQQWVAKLKGEVGDDALVDYFLTTMNDGINDTYAEVGGKFTEHRKGRFATRMLKYKGEPTMFAIEVFCDRHRGKKDERYICGIAKSKALLTEKELDADIDRHRAYMKDSGLFYEATHA